MKFLVLLLVLICGCTTLSVQQPPDQRGFVELIHVDAWQNSHKFGVFVPRDYDPNTPCPTILFLHGAGQIGADGKAQMKGGLAEAIRCREADFPFLVIFPQSSQGSWQADTADGQLAIEILKQVQRQYCIDPKRIYLTGYSMGGEGTWSLTAAHPELFAAILPICPGNNSKAVTKIKDIPCWCFQGDADAASTLADTRTMMMALKKAGGKPQYQEYIGVGHNCWDRTYRDPEVFDWLLSQQRR